MNIPLIDKAKEKLKQVFFMPKTKQAIITFGSAIAMAGIAYALYPLTAAISTVAVVIAHEFGHYIAAIATDNEAALPIFIPIGVVFVGITMTRIFSKEDRARIYAMGPLTGIFVCAVLLVVSIFIASESLLLSAAALGLLEFYNLMFGHDGKKIRLANSEEK